MYEAFFGLAKNPFTLSPDPSFLYLTESHREAYAGLMYALTARKGFVVLTGEVGTGKTTLLHALLKGSPQHHFSLVLNPSLTPAEFLEFAMHDFGIDLRRATNKAQRLVAFYEFLTASLRQGRTPVLVVDESHRLDPALLEEIRLLTNFENSMTKLLQIVLVGQPELDATLDRPDLRQLKQRIAVRLKVEPLSRSDVEQYIWHRLRIAGGKRSPFSPHAVARIAEISTGIPRVINSLADNALLVAFATDSTTVSESHVLEAAGDLHLLAEPDPAPKVVVKEPPKESAEPASLPAAEPEPAAGDDGWSTPAPQAPPSSDWISDEVPFIPRTVVEMDPRRKSGSMLSRWFGRLRSTGD